MRLCALAIAIVPAVCHSQPSLGTLRQLPTPFETIRDEAQFNALRLGPGNAIAIMKTPPDFRLAAIAISPDGARLAAAWESGRIEVWDIRSKQKTSEFKPKAKAQTLLFSSVGDELVVTARGGRIAFLALPSGKELRAWTVPLGRWKYDIQELLLPKNGQWLAYADEESSKVLDLTSTAPQVIADLHDAYSLALSQNETELWTVNRSRIEAFDTANWQSMGQWPLRSEPIKDQPVIMRGGASRDGVQSVVVPSSKGLVIYHKTDMNGKFVTDRPTSLVEFSKAVGAYLDLSRTLTLIDTEGRTLCGMAYSGSFWKLSACDQSGRRMVGVLAVRQG
jgi:WD40 repeat protein